MRWLAIFLAFLACCGKEKSNQNPVTLINIDSLLDHHLSNLSGKDVSLTKVSSINNHTNTTEISHQNINWKNELEPFRTIALINKPIYSSAYELTVNADRKSNLKVKTWVTQQDLPLKSLKIYYLGDMSQIKRLESSIAQSNFIFSSLKELKLNFGILGPNPTADKYQISGYQKFFWEEPQYFSMEGYIHIK